LKNIVSEGKEQVENEGESLKELNSLNDDLFFSLFKNFKSCEEFYSDMYEMS
jgi:hypothetical protein